MNREKRNPQEQKTDLSRGKFLHFSRTFNKKTQESSESQEYFNVKFPE